MHKDHRTEMREQVTLPVYLDGGKRAVTRDLSSVGLFIEMDGRPVLWKRIDLTVELAIPGQALQLKCHSEIVRIEQHGGRTGVAVRVLASRLEPLTDKHALNRVQLRHLRPLGRARRKQER